jgi:dUTP pyrophosphatase
MMKRRLQKFAQTKKLYGKVSKFSTFRKTPKIVYFKLLNENAKTPFRASLGGAGYDLYSSTEVNIAPYSRKLIPTGVSIEIDAPNTYARIAPRSSLSIHGIDVGAGVVDRDYRGEVFVLLINTRQQGITIGKGDRIAQLIFEKTQNISLIRREQLSNTERGSGGFGSTGKS